MAFGTTSTTGSVAKATAKKTLLYLFASIALLASMTNVVPCANATTTSVTATGTSTSDTDDTTISDCTEETEACTSDATCLECITESLSSSSQATCEDSYEDDSDTDCDYEASSYCCQSETSAMPACVNSDITIAYWTCILERSGCSLDDMPCLDAETPAPTSVDSVDSEDDDDVDDDDEADASSGTMGAARSSGAIYTGVVACLAILGMSM